MTAKRDYYEVLGLSKSSPASEIKSQYRKLALKFHPDRNKSAEASEHFKEISEAYAVLSDSKKRGIYDQYGHAGVDGKYSTEDIFQGASGNFNDVFNDLFGRSGRGGFESIFENFMGQGGGFGGRRQRGSDMLYETAISLIDVLKGKNMDLDLKKNVACNACEATGCEPGSSKTSCAQCGGHGQVRKSRNMGFTSFVTVVSCPKCRGEGQVIQKPCKECRGRGVKKGTKHLEFSIPPGADNGDYTIQNEGEFVPGGVNGDLIIRIHVEPHREFKRDGGDIFYDRDVSMTDAALGRKISVPTLDGTEDIVMDSGTQPNHIIKLKGRGVPHQGSGRGDQYVRIVVNIPKKLTKTQKKLLEEFDS